jgi:signal transduction histidine kinase
MKDRDRLFPSSTPAGTRVRSLFCVLAVLIGLFFSAVHDAVARDWVRGLSKLYDPRGELTLEEVRARNDWVSVRDVVSDGYTASTLWIKVDLAQGVPSETLRLRVRPAYLDRLDVFARDPDGQWGQHVRGDQQVRGGNTGSDSAFSVSLRRLSSEPIYLRVRTSSTMAVHVALIEEDDLYGVVAVENLLFGIYFGLMALLAIWSLVTAWIRQDRAIALFGVYLLMLFGMGLGISGIAASMLVVRAPADLWTTFFVLAATLSGTTFHRSFLGRFGLPLWAMRLLDLCIAIALLTWPLWLLLGPARPLMINAWSVLLTCAVTSLVAFLPGRRSAAEHRTLLFAYGLVLIGLFVTMLPVVGVRVGGPLSIYLTMGHGLLTGIVLSLMLARFGRLDLLERQRLELAEDQSKRELALISGQNQEYDRFLAMLTHELRNALGTASVVIRRLQSGEYPGVARQADTGRPMSIAAAATSAGSEVSTSLRRAASALRAASSVLDKVQAARQVEAGASSTPALGAVSEHLHEVLDRHSVDDALLDVDPSLTLIQDWTYVDLILSNLVENADRYRPPGTVIRIAARRRANPASGVEITVSNRRPELWTDDLERVFDKYWRGEHAQSRQGAGLGLWLARNAARYLGGELSCSAEGAEIAFHLSLPERAG